MYLKKLKYKNKLNAFLIVFLSWLVCVLILLNREAQDDTWRHLALGRLFESVGGLPIIEPFAISPDSKEFIDFSWLSCVAFWKSYHYFGEVGLILLVALIGSMGVIFRWLSAFFYEEYLNANCAQRFLAMAAPLLAAYSLLWRTVPRPEVFGYLFFAAYLSLDFKEEIIKKPKKLLVILFVILVLWMNFHSAASIVVIFELIYATAVALTNRALMRLSLLRMVVVLIALCCNPWGPTLLFSALRQGLEPMNLHIYEFKPLPLAYLNPIWITFFLIGYVGFYLGIKANNSNTTKISQSVTLLFITALSIRYSRGLPYLIIYILPYVSRFLNYFYNCLLRYKVRNSIIYSIPVVVLILITSEILRFGYSGLQLVKRDYTRIVDFAHSLGIKGLVLNDFGFGGYLMWKYGTDIKIFIDNRSPLYLKGSFPKFLKLNNLAKCKSVIDEYDYSMIIIGTPSFCDPNYFGHNFICGMPCACIDAKIWSLVQYNSDALLYVKKSALKKLKTKIKELVYFNPCLLTYEQSYEYVKFLNKMPGAKRLLLDEISYLLKFSPDNDRLLFYFDTVLNMQ